MAASTWASIECSVPSTICSRIGSTDDPLSPLGRGSERGAFPLSPLGRGPERGAFPLSPLGRDPERGAFPLSPLGRDPERGALPLSPLGRGLGRGVESAITPSLPQHQVPEPVDLERE